jgi:hypothetical protein
MNTLNFELIELVEIADKEAVNICGGVLTQKELDVFHGYLELVKASLEYLNEKLSDRGNLPRYIDVRDGGENISSNRRLSESGRPW